MAAPEAPLEPPKEPTTPKEDTQPYDDRLSEATTLFNDDQTDKVTQKQKPFFDFKRDCNLDGPEMWIQVVGVVKVARAMDGGGDDEALSKEAWEKLSNTFNPSREYTFYGLVVNEIQNSLADRLEKRRAKKKS